MLTVRLSYTSIRTNYVSINFPTVNCGNKIGGDWSAEAIGTQHTLTCIVSDTSGIDYPDLDVTITNTGVKYGKNGYGGFFISSYTYHIRNHICENPLPIIFSDTSQSPLESTYVINACVSIPESCFDVKSSEYPQNCLVTLSLSNRFSDQNDVFSANVSIDDSGAGEQTVNWESQDLNLVSSYLGGTARFTTGSVRDTGSITLWGRVKKSYIYLGLNGVAGLTGDVSDEIPLVVFSFNTPCSSFADVVSYEEDWLGVFDGDDADVTGLVSGLSYFIELTKISWSGFEPLENYCCDDVTEVEPPFEPEKIVLPQPPENGTVPLPPDEETGEVHFGEGGRIGESINIECICNNLIYLTGAVNDLQKIKTDLSGLNSVLSSIHQDLVSIKGELDGSLFAHIEGEKLGLASILYGRSSGSSEINFQDLLDKLDELFTNKKEGEQKKNTVEVLEDVKDELHNKDLQVDVYADASTEISSSRGYGFRDSEF